MSENKIQTNEKKSVEKLMSKLEIAKKYALYQGGECLSSEYINNKKKLEWKCQNVEHKSWLSNYSNIVTNGRWCPQCGKEKSNKSTNIKKLSNNLKKAKEYAISKNGKCLTDIRLNGLDKLEWKCHNQEHSAWFSLYNNVVNMNTWCPECDKEKRYLTNGLEIAKNHAESKGGQCLSTKYDSLLKMEWKCHNQEHSAWFAFYIQVINNSSWCPECNNEKRKLSNGLEKAIAYAENRNGKCLSTSYKNSRSKLEWKCHNNEHKSWFSTYNNVVNNDSWCNQCGIDSMGKKHKLINGLQKAQEYASSKGGKCLSNHYKNANSKMKWKCSCTEHKLWETTYAHAIYHNTWCPECSLLKRTKLIKFESGLLNSKKYAENKGGKCLSTQCDSRGSRLEWKCHNKNHSSWFATYNNTLGNNTWCRECKKENKTNKNLLKAQKHAENKGGKCLSKECTKKNERLEWKCHNPQHPSWFSIYSNVVEKDCWCKLCNAELRFPKKNYFNIAKKHAEEKKGQCLSNEYLGQKIHMQWKCHKKEHPIWLASYDNVVKNGSWCPECRVDNLIQTTQEFRVRKILNYLFKTSFIKTRGLSWNVNNKTNHKLELDGYSKELNLAFEFQGRQHFEENIFKGTNLSVIQERDKCKKENCQNNGVKLIIIEELKDKKTCQKFFQNIIIGIKNANIEVPKYDDNEIEKLYKLKPENDQQKINYKKLKNL